MKTRFFILLATTIAISSCGTSGQIAGTQQYQDGIYARPTKTNTVVVGEYYISRMDEAEFV